MKLDLELPFATGEDVMTVVEGFVKALFSQAAKSFVLREAEGTLVPFRREETVSSLRSFPPLWTHCR